MTLLSGSALALLRSLYKTINMAMRAAIIMTAENNTITAIIRLGGWCLLACERDKKQ